MPDYFVKVEIRDVGEQHRLVRAKNQAAALDHVVAGHITIERATIDDVVRLTKAGVDVEVAS